MDLTPEQLAEIQRLKALMQKPVTEAQRKAQAMWNAEQMSKKADGGVMRMSQGGSDDEYRGSHQAPGPHFGAPMHNVAQGMYPEDFYGPMGQRYYASEGWDFDRDAYNKVARVKNKPNEMVSIHRAVPTSVYKEALKKDAPLKHMIRKGDWVAIHKDYAKSHGESALNGDYKIASMRVPAKHVWTNADSIHEWGYHPDEPVKAKKAEGGTMDVDAMRLALMNKKRHMAYGGPARNWAPGEEEKLKKALSSLKKKVRTEGINNHTAQDAEHDTAINQWIDSVAHNYVKKSMATEKDPVRQQAENDVFHLNMPEEPGYWQRKGETRRKISGGEQMAKSEKAKTWENRTDAMLEAEEAQAHQDMMHLAPGMYSEKDEWVKKLDPKAKLWNLTEHFDTRDLGLDHIRDVLHEDLVSGRIRPEQLSKISMAQAVQRAHQYDQEMEKKRQETAIKQTEGMPTVHEYHEDGMKWIELAAKDPQAYEESIRHLESNPREWQKSIEQFRIDREKQLADALKYEGDTMGHCVGGYCPDVLEGRSRIFSLRDKKGEPHVTIETEPSKKYDEDEIMAAFPSGVLDAMKSKGQAGVDEYVASKMQELNSTPDRIVQIKGKGNAKPHKKYIPHVQHFVKSGEWSDVGDIKNAELKHIDTVPEKERFEQAGMDLPKYVSEKDHDDLINEYNSKTKQPFDPEFFAKTYGVQRKAQGGTVLPTIEQMKMALMMGNKAKPNLGDLRSVGVNEAPSLGVKAFVSPAREGQGPFPVGGVDLDPMQPGQQMLAPQPPQEQPQQGQPPQGGVGTTPPPQGGSNILQMTPQGQAMAAMKPPAPPQQPPQMATGGGVASIQHPFQSAAQKPVPFMMKSGGSYDAPMDNQSMDNGATTFNIDNIQELAKGGSLGKKSVAQMKQEMAGDDKEEESAPSKRITIKAEGPGGVTGIVVPHHMLHGRSWISKKTNKLVKVPGMLDINKARAKVYGSENRPPMSIGQVGKLHKQTLEEHFSKPLKEQLSAEQQATEKLRAAKHLGEKANTLDKSEKLDTVNHEHDEKGRTYIGFASKGVAGHSLYTSGHGKNMKHHVINTCPGQTVGCGGGTDEHGVVDTSKGTCFAPNAESQYVHAAVRRATHEQAKHDPAMSKDWILAHTGSMRKAANLGDKGNKVLLFRPNVVDETDVSSRHVIRHLNKQREAAGKPKIIANSYGKTNELHDPENGYYVTHSNVGPKTKKGESIAENIARDRQRVRSTIHATDAGGKDIKNEEGHKTPPKNSYMVTDVKRNSPLSKKMEGAITHAKYWSAGRHEHELTADEKEEGEEGHFGGNGKPTSEDKAHYGHRTLEGKRFDYQRQHILHPRLVQVGKNKDGSPHMIPTDSRFKDEEFLPKNRFKTKNGKNAGAIVMTTPTESTSNIGHDTSFTHHVNEKHVEHALKHNGEYEIDKPEDQIKSQNKEYVEPRAITIRRAEGGTVGSGSDLGDDDFHAFPEQNGMAQRHMTMRHDPEEFEEIGHLPFLKKSKTSEAKKNKVKFSTDMDTINLELLNKRKKAQ